METQSDRVRALMIARGVPERQMRSALADVCGIRYQSVKGWFDGTTKAINADNLARIAKHWGASLEWLVSGSGTMDPAGVSNIEETAEKYSPKQRRAPVISWVKAGAWEDAQDPFQPGDAEDWEPVPDSAGPNAFWLRVLGDSMTAPHGDSIPEGHLILVDPDFPALPGRLVVAKLEDTDEATFKKLVQDAGRMFLKPLNPAYPTIPVDQNCKIVGAVRESKKKY